MSIRKKKEIWVENGLITAEQGERIVTFEQSRRLISPTRAFALLGALAFGLGCVTLIAAHWEKLSDVVKSVGYLVLLTLFAAGCARASLKKPILFEAGLIADALLLLGGIGLTAQIYHLNGETWQTLLLYGVLLIPLLAATRRSVLMFVEIPLFVFAFLMSPWGNVVTDFLFSKNLAAMTVMILSYAGVVATVLLTLFRKENRFRPALSFYACCVAFVPLFVPFEERGVRLWETRNFSVAATVCAMMIIVVLTMFLFAGMRRSALFRDLKSCLWSLAGVYAVYALTVSLNDGVMTPLFQAAVFMGMALFFSVAGQYGMFVTVTVLTALRVLEFFVVAFASLFDTGTGLMLFGVLLWGTAYGWRRMKNGLWERVVAKGKR